MRRNIALKSAATNYFLNFSYLLHIVPVGNDTMFDWVLQSEDTSLALGLVSYVGILLSHTDHDSLMTGTSDD